MEKINFNDLPNTNTPINSSNLNQLQTNIENAIEEKNIYLTEEQRIGTWLGKPLYRKVITNTTGTTEGVWKTIDSSLANVDEVITLVGTIEKTLSVPAYVVSGYSVALQYTNNTGVQVIAYGYLGSNIKVIIEYTKTTD